MESFPGRLSEVDAELLNKRALPTLQDSSITSIEEKELSSALEHSLEMYEKSLEEKRQLFAGNVRPKTANSVRSDMKWRNAVGELRARADKTVEMARQARRGTLIVAKGEEPLLEAVAATKKSEDVDSPVEPLKTRDRSNFRSINSVFIEKKDDYWDIMDGTMPEKRLKFFNTNNRKLSVDSLQSATRRLSVSEDEDEDVEEANEVKDDSTTSSATTSSLIRDERVRIDCAITEWAEVKLDRFSVKLKRTHSAQKNSPVRKTSDVSVTSFATDSSDAPIEKLLEDETSRPYVLDESLYFGEAARIRFFGRYQELAAEYDKYTTSKHRGVFKRCSVVEAAQEERMRNLSPRTRFLSRFMLKFDTPPLPIIIRQDRSSEEINLAHFKLRDEYMVLFSEVLHDLPRLSKLNVCDNQLTDRGLCPLLLAIAQRKSITELNLSENKLDSLSAAALCGLIRSPDCPLKSLHLCAADLDDDEVSTFMIAFEENRTITDLNLSRNLLGATEKFIDCHHMMTFEAILQMKISKAVGGAAVANALLINAYLQRIDLSWNSLGSYSAAVFFKAIQATNTLVELNLAYNAIKDVGAEAISAALFDNHSLRKLDCSSNGITHRGCVSLAAALRVNDKVSFLSLAQNPIGDIGGRAILATLNYHSVKRVIKIEGCTYPVESTETLNNLAILTGRYDLNCANTRDRIIAMELYRLASMRRGCIFRRIEYYPDRKKPRKEQIKLVRPSNPAEFMGHAYSPWKGQASRPRHVYTMLEAHNWRKVLSSLELVQVGSGWPWVVPTVGRLVIDFRYYPRSPTPIECLNITGFERLQAMLSTQVKSLTDLLRICAHSLILETDQLDEIMAVLVAQNLKPHALLDVFMKLLPCVRDATNLDALIRRYFNSHLVREIELTLRQYYPVLLGSYSGHYKLDLSNSMDRQCAIRLAEINADELLYIRQSMPSWSKSKSHCYTSQGKQRSNFRNVYYQKASLELTDEFFMYGLLDKNGTLEFDYVSTTRPAEDVEPLEDFHLNTLLVMRRLRCPVEGIQYVMDEHREEMKSVVSEEEEGKRPLSRRFGLLVKSCPVLKRRGGVAVSSSVVGSAGGSNSDDMISQELSTPAGLQKGDSRDFSADVATSASIETIANQASAISKSFQNRFKRIRSVLGVWLYPDRYNTQAKARDAIAEVSDQLLRGFSYESTQTILREITRGEALYFAGDALHRFVTRVTIRLHSDDIPVISKILTGADMSKKHRATFRSKRMSTRGKPNFPVSMKAASSRVNTPRGASSKPSPTHAEVEYYGSVLEICCAYNVVLTSELGDSAPASSLKSPQICDPEVVMEHTGSYPSTRFLSSGGIVSVPYIGLHELALQSCLKETEPTHKRFRIFEDVVVSGCEITFRLKVQHWSDVETIGRYVEGYMLRLFQRFGVSLPNMRRTHCSSLETKEDVFADARLARTVTTHVSLYRFDYILSDIPFQRESVFKLTMSSTQESTQLMASGRGLFGSNRDAPLSSITERALPMRVGVARNASVVVGDPDNPNKESNGAIGRRTTKMLSGLSSSETASYHQTTGSSEDAVPTGVVDYITTKSDVGKLFTIWRWRDIHSEDRDVASNDEDREKFCNWSHMLSDLRALSSRLWLTSKQAARIAADFPVSVASEAHLREQVIICLFSRVVDLENFDLVLSTMPLSKHATLLNRLGWMNVINFMNWRNYLDLDFRIPDNRKLAGLLIMLLLHGGGVSMCGERFRRSFGPEEGVGLGCISAIADDVQLGDQIEAPQITQAHGEVAGPSDFIPGWELPSNWDAIAYKGNLPKGIPGDGNFVCMTRIKDDEETNADKLARFHKTRSKVAEGHSLLCVPRGDDRDLMLKLDGDREDNNWDGLKL